MLENESRFGSMLTPAGSIAKVDPSDDHVDLTRSSLLLYRNLFSFLSLAGLVCCVSKTLSAV